MSKVEVILDGKSFKYWTGFRITQGIDSFATVALSAPMHQDFKEVFRPFAFPTMLVNVDGERVFTGRLIEVSPNSTAEEWSVSLNAYETAAILSDTHSEAALQFIGQTLSQIAVQITAEFGILVEAPIDTGAPFDREEIDVDQTPLDFLTDLAKKRGFVLRGNASGGLVIHDPNTYSLVVATLTEGYSPLLDCSVQFSPREYYSTVIGRGEGGEKAVVENPFWPVGVPKKVLGFSDQETDPQTAAEAKLGRMFANACAFSVNVSTWKTPAKALWRPGDLIVLDAPHSMVYTPTVLFVRSVTLEQTESGETAALELCLPGVFSGKVPSTLPWEN